MGSVRKIIKFYIIQSQQVQIKCPSQSQFAHVFMYEKGWPFFSGANQDYNQSQHSNKRQSIREQIQEQYNKAQQYRPIGIRNIGNTCYISSVLQCLYKTREFSSKLQKKTKFMNKNECPLSNQFSKFNDYMNSSKNTNPFNPMQIKKIVENKNYIFANYNQNDASQFLLTFLFVISNQLNQPNSTKLQKPIDNYIGSQEQSKEKEKIYQIYKQTKQTDQLRQRSIVDQTFTGRYQVTYTCKKCLIKYVMFQKFNIHYLQIPNKKSFQPRKYKLQDCLKTFTQKEELNKQNQMTCGGSNCGKQTDHCKVMQVYELNQVLVIAIKRFYKGAKNTAEIELPFEILAQEIVMKERKTVYQGKIYKLYAAILHFGTLKGGHYTAAILNQRNNKWIQISDERVSQEKDFRAIDIKNAYVVCYKLTEKSVDRLVNSKQIDPQIQKRGYSKQNRN